MLEDPIGGGQQEPPAADLQAHPVENALELPPEIPTTEE